MEEKIRTLRDILTAHAPLLVAYSGGVDSTFLLAFAHETLGDRVLGVIADSPSLPRAALAEALDTARRFGAAVEVIATREFDNPSYISNPPNRCYFCKAELFSRMESLARARGFQSIAYGENADDPADLRPGSRAAAEFHVLAPLKQAGLGKDAIRALSRARGLPTADAPAQPCLSSRIPHGTPVTREALSLVEKGESALRSLGFRVFRVRYLADAPGRPRARVQIALSEMPRLEQLTSDIHRLLAEAGFASSEIDPAGYVPPAPLKI